MGRSFLVIFLDYGIQVNLALQFNDQLFGRAIKIDNIPIDAVLFMEFSAFQLFCLQMSPKESFGGGKVFPELLPSFQKFLPVMVSTGHI